MADTTQTGTELPAGSPETPKEASPEADKHREASEKLATTATSSELEMLKTSMVGLLRTNYDADFQGNFDSAEEFEKNEYFKRIQEGLREFLESNKIAAPLQIKKAWIDACVNFIVAEIGSYNNASGAMGVPEVALALEALKDPAKKGHSEQNGVGNFETWVDGSGLKEEYATWKAEQEQKAEAQKADQEIQKTKQDLQAKLAALKARVNTPAMKNDVAPAVLLTRVSDLTAKIAANGKDDLPQLSKDAQELEIEIADIEKLIADFDTNEIPTEAKRQFFTEVKEGKKTAAQAREAFEQAKKTAQAAADKPDEEDVPFIDKAKAFIDKMPDGPWKKTLGKLLAGATALIITLVKLPWIGDKLRGGPISNTMLAEWGDKKAQLALKVEGEFKKFGLSRRLANDLGGMKTAEVVKTIKEKPGDISSDIKVQGKLAWLEKQLEVKGGDKSEQSLFEFMNPDGDWKDIKYKQPDTASVSNTPPAAPTVTPPALQVAPTAVPPIAVATPPPPPAQQPPAVS